MGRPNSSSRDARRPVTCRSAGGWLEQLDEVPRWVLYEDLGPAGTGDHLVAEGHPFGLEAVDLSLQVGDHEVDAVPPAGVGSFTVGHGTPGGAPRTREQKSQVSPRDVGERR